MELLTEVSRYPQQIAVIKRKLITLGIDANLELAGTATNTRGEEIIVPPLSMHGPYSCFRWTLIDKSGPVTVYPIANIPSGEAATLRTKVNAIIAQNALKAPRVVQTDAAEPLGPAYTTKIRMNKFKGRTPASVLLENPKNMDDLLEILNYLQSQDSQSRYWESNQQQIQAIEEAVELFNKKELSEEMVDNTAAGALVVYHRPHKVLLNRPPKGDHYFVYSFKIDFLEGYDYPWRINIANAYMKIKKKSDGTHETVPNTAIEKSVSQLQVTDYEMGYLVERIYNTMVNFELIFFKKQYAESARQYQELMNHLRTEERPDKAA